MALFTVPWRAVTVVALTGTLLAGVAVSPLTPAGAQGVGAPTVTGQHTVGGTDDFASLVHGDPWDFANASDVQTDAPIVAGPTAFSVADGRLRYHLDATGHFHLVWSGFPGGLRLGRDGPAQPVDADRFTHASFSIRSSRTTVAGLMYDTCPDVTSLCQGQLGFVLEPGWQTVTLDLREGTAAQAHPWRGQVHAVRLTVGTDQPMDVEVDWARLHPAGAGSTVTWTTPPLARSSQLVWDADTTVANNTPDQPGWGVLATTDGLTGAGEFPAWAYPPGAYRFYVQSGSTTSPASAPLVVESPPRIVIDDPDVTGGEDYATAVLGDPWDFEQPTDVAVLENVADVVFSGGQLHGTNGGPTMNDPVVQLRTGPPIDPARYHRLTVTTSYDGRFDLADAPGGGAHGRWSWRQDGYGSTWIQTKEVVTYTDVHTYTVDLATGPALLEDDLAPQPTWGSAPVHTVRWDVNEDRGPRRWRIDEVRLSADDEALGSFTITWHDDAHAEGVTVDLWADTDTAGFDGLPIASGLRQQPGRNTYLWDTSAVPPGTYHVWALARSPEGTATTRVYATGPLQVRPGSPPHAEDDGVRLAGPERVSTAVALARAAFPDGASTAVLARAGDFPDALAATPLAVAAGGPVLLNPTGALHDAVAAELQRLGVTTVYLTGGRAALSDAVEQALAARGYTTVRLAGPERYTTAAAIAVEAAARWGGEHGPPLLALGTTFVDALAASSLAGHDRRPLLLVTADGLPAATLEALETLEADSVTVIGGRGVLQEVVFQRLADADLHVSRLDGADHYETAAVVSEAALPDPPIAIVASGEAFPDALAAGPAAVHLGGVLLLTPAGHVAPATSDALRGVPQIHVAGGPAAVADATVAALLSR